GGHLAAGVVRERIVRAFLVEEQKIVRKVLKLQKAKEVAAAKLAAKQGKNESKGKKASKKPRGAIALDQSPEEPNLCCCEPLASSNAACVHRQRNTTRPYIGSFLVDYSAPGLDTYHWSDVGKSFRDQDARSVNSSVAAERDAQSIYDVTDAVDGSLGNGAGGGAN
ncbi:hypothetical protein H632_c3373p0, partial [Helicosporidium sp. ATCC 50920]